MYALEEKKFTKKKIRHKRCHYLFCIFSNLWWYSTLTSIYLIIIKLVHVWKKSTRLNLRVKFI